MQDVHAAERADLWYQRQPVVILWLAVLSAVLFVVAYTAKTTFERRRDHMARQWFATGEVALRQSRPGDAIEDFRSALAYAPANRQYRLKLAQALASAGHNQEAAAHLLNLWESEPGSGELNLDLARVAVRMGNSEDALRYFHSAIYGLWNENPAEHRREARLELITFLLSRKLNTQAQSELLALLPDLPGTPDSYRHAASLFMQAGDNRHALKLYGGALRLQRNDGTALAGAAEAAFALGDYRRAAQYFRDAAKVQTLPSNLEQMASTSEAAVNADPFAVGLTSRQRSVRALAALDRAGERLQNCASDGGDQLATEIPKTLQSDYDDWTAMKRNSRSVAAQRDPDFIRSVMELVFRIEEHTRPACGEPSGSDLALLLLAREHAEQSR